MYFHITYLSYICEKDILYIYKFKNFKMYIQKKR